MHRKSNIGRSLSIEPFTCQVQDSSAYRGGDAAVCNFFLRGATPCVVEGNELQYVRGIGSEEGGVPCH